MEAMKLNNITELFSAVSQNARWGLSVVGPENTKFPAEGSIKHIGRVGGIEVYIFEPGNTKTWVNIMDDVDIHQGATIIDKQDLQGNGIVSLVLLGEFAVIEHYGYNRRGSYICAYINGKKTNIPQSILAASGVAKVKGEKKEINPPPPIDNELANKIKELYNEYKDKKY